MDKTLMDPLPHNYARKPPCYIFHLPIPFTLLSRDFFLVYFGSDGSLKEGSDVFLIIIVP